MNSVCTCLFVCLCACVAWFMTQECLNARFHIMQASRMQRATDILITSNSRQCTVMSCHVMSSSGFNTWHARTAPRQATCTGFTDRNGWHGWTRMYIMYSEGLRLDGMLCALAELRVGCERLSSCGRAHFNALLNRLEKPKESIVTAIVRERRIL